MRKGSSEGYTEIHLSSGQPRPIIIKRCLSSTSNSTEWYINGALLTTCASWHLCKARLVQPFTAACCSGAKSTQAAVLEKVNDLNIQVDNLCQVHCWRSAYASVRNVTHSVSSSVVCQHAIHQHADDVHTSCLLQFLPQDKVVMFARLTPTELLKETEKSIGDGELYNIHTQLIEKKEEENDTSHVSVHANAVLRIHVLERSRLSRLHALRSSVLQW